MTVFEVHHLRHWEECRGPFTDLKNQDGQLIATIAGLMIALPSEMHTNLVGCIGKRIAVLRGDDMDYRLRCLETDGHA